MKTCTKCNIEKPANLDNFPACKGNVDGLHGSCKTCRSDYRKIQYQNNKNHEKTSSLAWKLANPEIVKDSRLKKLYSIDLNQYNQMFSNQEGKCSGCERHQTELNRMLDTDHDHKTGQVRGLLCYNCNTLLGLAHDNVRTLENLIVYLNRSKIKLVESL